jgi:hypothetical protein
MIIMMVMVLLGSCAYAFYNKTQAATKTLLALSSERN